MKDGKDDEGWVYVSGRRPARCVKVGVPRSVVANETVCRAARERVIRAVAEATDRASDFLTLVIKKLRKCIRRGANGRIVALGLGSPTALTLPLTRAFCCQFAVCLIAREALGIERVDVFDPIMDASDVEVCRSLLEGYHPDLSRLRLQRAAPSPFGEEDVEASDVDGEPLVLLWMPHCEAELYKAVLLDLEGGVDPLIAAKALAGVECRDQPVRYKLRNVVMMGNSLEKYEGDLRLPEHIVRQAVQTALPAFDPFPQAFSDTYLTQFTLV